MSPKDPTPARLPLATFTPEIKAQG